MVSRDYPNNIITLFPEKVGTNPLENPIIKAFLEDISVHTKRHALDVEDDTVTMTWVTNGYTINVTVNTNLKTASVVSHDKVGYNNLKATVQLGGKSNRWVGYFIDDLT